MLFYRLRLVDSTSLLTTLFSMILLTCPISDMIGLISGQDGLFSKFGL